MIRSHAVLWGFLAANLLLKLAIGFLNRGEYTDGILQLTVFDGPGRRAGLYPPLFGGLAWMVSGAGHWFPLEAAGRAVSALAATLALLPVWFAVRRLGSEAAARWAALFFTLSPLILRWSGHAMTDALFLVLSAGCLHAAWLAWNACADAWRIVGDRTGGAVVTTDASARAPVTASAPPAEDFGSPTRNSELRTQNFRRADRALAAAVALAALAGLTRYQGALLAVPLLLPFGAYLVAMRRLPWRAIAAGILWLAIPLWMRWSGFEHAQQFTSRTAPRWQETALAYWNLAESFVLIAPYYFGYPIAILAVAGLFARGEVAAQTSRAADAPEHGAEPSHRLVGGDSSAWKSAVHADEPNHPDHELHHHACHRAELSDHHSARLRLLLLYAVWAAVLLPLQSAFGSFQYRYMLPLLPVVLVLAGLGAARFETWASRAFAPTPASGSQHSPSHSQSSPTSPPSAHSPLTQNSELWTQNSLKVRRLLFSAATLASLSYLTLFSCAVLALQRGTYADQRDAADFLRQQAPANARIFANERYGERLELGCVKLSYWSGRRVEPLRFPQEPTPASPFSLAPAAPPAPAAATPKPGDIVVLSNAYGGNDDALLGALSASYRLRLLTPPFTSQITPLLDDVMVSPMFNQNPLAWVVRYVPQPFHTRIFVVEGGGREQPNRTP